jgi:acetyl-CoA carboxylase biotin carboxyl carrier protein
MASKASQKDLSAETASRPAEASSPQPPWPSEHGPSVIDEVRQLVQLMVDNDLAEVDISDGQRKILLKRGGAYVPAMHMVPAGRAMPSHSDGWASGSGVPAQAATPPAAGGAKGAEEPTAEKLLEIRSPMVGTFYTSPSPDSDVFVTVGSAIDEDAVVCIVEAMKVMNEVKAECAGTIAEICVKNAQPVEYGQVLFRVRPA